MRRLLALLLAAVVAAGSLWVAAGHGTTGAYEGGYAAYPSAAQVSNFGYMLGEYRARSASGDRPRLVFGSSELNPVPAGPDHPASLFRRERLGMDPMVVGRASCSSLWQAIEMGAFAHSTGEKRMVLFASIQWFMCYRAPRRELPGVFSEGAYESFMSDPKLSDGLKRRVTDRLAEYGIDRRWGSLGLLGLSRRADVAAHSLASDLRLRSGLALTGGVPFPGVSRAPAAGRRQPAGENRADGPDWRAVISRATDIARGHASGNPYGFYDAWYRKYYRTWLEGVRQRWPNKLAAMGSYFSDQEFEDFEMALETCREEGIDLLVVIQPVKGAAYDRTVYTRDVRERYDARMRVLCGKYGAQVADFSDHDYDPLFLRDYSHPSDLGGAYYSRAIYSFFKTGRAEVGEPES